MGLAEHINFDPAVLRELSAFGALRRASGFTEEGRARGRERRLCRGEGWRAVLLVGKDPAGIAKEKLPDSVIAVDYVAHAKLFRRASVIVHHGGIGTTGESLRAGAPMLVVPHSHDQPDNAFRVKNLGVAESAPAHKYTAKLVAMNLVHAGGYFERAEQIGRLVRSEDGVATACDAIERLLAEPVGN